MKYLILLKEAFMKYLWLSVMVVLALTACTPQASIENNVIPQLISAKIKDDGTVLLQGRYFGDGQAGASEASYVILGGDVNCENGVAVRAGTWSPSRVAVGIPNGAGYGFTCVVVDGVKSNALPINLQ
jgi:hypothetical protein